MGSTAETNSTLSLMLTAKTAFYASRNAGIAQSYNSRVMPELGLRTTATVHPVVPSVGNAVLVIEGGWQRSGRRSIRPVVHLQLIPPVTDIALQGSLRSLFDAGPLRCRASKRTAWIARSPPA